MGVSGIQSNYADAKWRYPEYEVSNCVCHMVSPGLDGLNVFILTYFG